MSRTKRGEKGAGYDYWKSRCNNYHAEDKPGRFTKRLTHKEERRKAKGEMNESGYIY
jgi:hypothetical protein